MNSILFFRFIYLVYVGLILFFFQNDFSFFLNPELIVNGIFFFLFLYSINLYYNLNQKSILFQKNEVRKKNVIFFQAFLCNWKRAQYRNKRLKKIYILRYLNAVFKALEEEIIAQKSYLEIDLKQYIISHIYSNMVNATVYLNDVEKIQKTSKGLLLLFWFTNLK
uniref:Uncharacterized protein n=1 Tax=Eukaryota sp. BB2 TaxID=1949062 RepID=A0A1X8VEY0_9EUKA|nr:hypothetical protein CCM08_mgp42 [Eukaryota sp. BB2]AQL10465.1 hypothetical protein [Eukaryota sp. BB2]